MEAPICLIKNTANENLVVNPEAINILSGINQPVVVVSIIGMYRTGKSYLMNKLAGSHRGFKLGATLQPETKGIWMWCVPHPVKKDHTLVLLDTEGLEYVEKGYGKNDIWIIALALLLSSAMVYNSKGIIDQDALDKLKFVPELPELIKVRSKENDDEEEAEFSRHFPIFIWALRDFHLNLKIDGARISADDYLERALKSFRSQRDIVYNQTRRCLQMYFRDRKCFVFDIPTTNKEFLQRLEEVPDNELNKNFVDQCKEFCDYIWKNADTKRVNYTVIVTGHRLGELAKIYTEALCSSKFVCIEDAVLALAEKENEAAFQESTQHYEDKMKTVGLPTETLDDFMTLSSQYEAEARQIFQKRSFNDKDQNFLRKLMERIFRKEGEFSAMNEAKSRELCQALIKKHSVDFEKALKDGAYHTQGGHAKFKEDLKVIEKKYNVENGKGVKAEEVLLKFILSQQRYEFLIIQEDNALNQKQKEEEEKNTRKKNVAVEEKLQNLQKIQKEQMELQNEKWLKSLKMLMEETDKQERVPNAKIDLITASMHHLRIQSKQQVQKDPSGTSWYDPITNHSKGVAAALFPGLLKKGETFPSTLQEWQTVAFHFASRWDFPNCEGAIDGKRVRIVPPPNSWSYYYIYKGYNSIVILAVVSATYDFLYVDVGKNVRISDGGVIALTEFYWHLQSGSLGLPPPEENAEGLLFVFVADEAFALSSHLMRPFPMRTLTLDQRLFNFRLSRARRVVENTFGVMASRFRLFLTPIHMAEYKLNHIVLSCCILHNLKKK